MVKVIFSVYQHIQSNWPYPYPNINYALPQISCSFKINKSTSYCGAYVGSHNSSSPVSDQNTINLVDTDVYNNDNFQSFETPMKHNRSATKLCHTTMTTTQIHIKYHTRPFQKNYSTIKYHCKFLHLERSISVEFFKPKMSPTLSFAGMYQK